MDVITTVNIAHTGSNSLRTTIPLSIAVYLDLELGSKLRWKMTTQKRRRAAIVLQVVEGSVAKPTERNKKKKPKAGK